MVVMQTDSETGFLIRISLFKGGFGTFHGRLVVRQSNFNVEAAHTTYTVLENRHGRISVHIKGKAVTSILSVYDVDRIKQLIAEEYENQKMVPLAHVIT